MDSMARAQAQYDARQPHEDAGLMHHLERSSLQDRLDALYGSDVDRLLDDGTEYICRDLDEGMAWYAEGLVRYHIGAGWSGYLLKPQAPPWLRCRWAGVLEDIEQDKSDAIDEIMAEAYHEH